MTERFPIRLASTTIAALVLALGGLPAAAQTAAAAAELRPGDYIVAIVNSELVTAGEVQLRMQRVQQEAARNRSRLPPEDESKIIASFRTLRNKEYAEIVEECETKFVKEIEFEHFRQNYTFEEAEEISQDLEKIRRWFARVTERDWFAADGRQAVEGWIVRCQELLDGFEQAVYRRRGNDADGPDDTTLAGGASPPPPDLGKCDVKGAGE